MTENDRYHQQLALARTEIKNLRQQISALKHEHIKEVKNIQNVLDGLRCYACGDKATTVIQNHKAELTPPPDMDCIPFKPIGVIETSFQNKRGVPRQPTVVSNVQGTLVIDTRVFNNPEHALIGLEEFSHIWVIFHFHSTDSTSVLAKVAPPRLGGERRGVFATRSPHRPCPIGLSLVKIQAIEGNKIHFFGVDMVNGTPVLDIKPYIPQYDHPASFDPSTAVRPRTEGVSDVPGLAGLTVTDQVDGQSVTRPSHPISANTPSPSYNEIPSPEMENISVPMSPSPQSESSILDSTPRMDTERGAPDGQERFTPPFPAQLSNLNDGIRIASWISNPPSQAFEVTFTTDALERLNELIGERAHSFKNNIQRLLSEDPRSQYVKSRYPDHEYSCVLEDLSISCIFDSSNSMCTIIAVRSADEMQQS